MDTWFFFQIVAAVLLANALTVWWCYSMWRITKIEKETGDPKNAPFVHFVGAAFAPIIFVAGAYFLS